MSITIEPRYAVTTPLTTIFTPPASCSSHWTYEAAFYNSVNHGLLIQDALSEHPDTACFPSGFAAFGRVPTVTQIFSPGACPAGYSTAANSFNGATTTAVCCPSSFSYEVTYSNINYYSSSAQFLGCVSTYPSTAGYTTVIARANNTDLNTTSVTGPITMWAQPISVAFQQADLAYFTTTSSSSSTSSTASASSSPTRSTASQTSAPTTAGTTASAATSQGTNNGLSGGAIAGIAIAAAAVLGIIIGLAIFFAFRRRKEKAAAVDSNTDEKGAADPGVGQDYWNGNQQYNPVPQELPSHEPQEMPARGWYGNSLRRPGAKDASGQAHEMTGERDPVEIGP